MLDTVRNNYGVRKSSFCKKLMITMRCTCRSGSLISTEEHGIGRQGLCNADSNCFEGEGDTSVHRQKLYIGMHRMISDLVIE